MRVGLRINKLLKSTLVKSVVVLLRYFLGVPKLNQKWQQEYEDVNERRVAKQTAHILVSSVIVPTQRLTQIGLVSLTSSQSQYFSVIVFIFVSWNREPPTSLFRNDILGENSNFLEVSENNKSARDMMNKQQFITELHSCLYLTYPEYTSQKKISTGSRRCKEASYTMSCSQPSACLQHPLRSLLLLPLPVEDNESIRSIISE